MRKLLLIFILSLLLPHLSANAALQPNGPVENADGTVTLTYTFGGLAAQSSFDPFNCDCLPNSWYLGVGSSTSFSNKDISIDAISRSQTNFTINKTYGLLFSNPSTYGYVMLYLDAGKHVFTFKKNTATNPTFSIIQATKSENTFTVHYKADNSTRLGYYRFGTEAENTITIDNSEEGAYVGWVAIVSNSKPAALYSYSYTYTPAAEDETYSVTGAVIGWDNLIMPGTEVTLLDGLETKTTTTDNEGKFTFTGVSSNRLTVSVNQNMSLFYMPYSQEISDIIPTDGVYNWDTITLQRPISELYLTVDGSGNTFYDTIIKNNDRYEFGVPNNYTADFYGAVFSLYRVTESYNPDDDADKSTLKSFISADNFIDSITFDEDNCRFEFDILDAVNSNGYVLTCSPDDYEYNTFEPIFIPVYDAAQASIDTPYIIQYTKTTNEFNLFKYFRPKTFTITGGIYEWDGDLVINDKAYFTLIRHDRVYDSNGEFTYSDTGLPSIPITQDNGIFTYIGDVRAANYFKYDVLCGVAEDLHPGEKWYCDDLEDYNFEGRDITLRGLAYKAGSYSLDSTVVNEWGVPVAHAKVEVFNAGSKCGHSCITDGNGNFHIIYADPDPDPNPDPDETTPSSAPAFAPTVFEDGAEIDPDFKSDDPKQQGYYVKITPENDLYKTTVLDFDPNKSEINIKENGNTVVGNTKSLATTFRMDSGTITGIENVAEEDNAADRVTVNGRDICVAGNANVEVFTIAGSRCGLTNLPAGIYIVRVDGRSYKLLIP